MEKQPRAKKSKAPTTFGDLRVGDRFTTVAGGAVYVKAKRMELEGEGVATVDRRGDCDLRCDFGNDEIVYKITLKKK